MPQVAFVTNVLAQYRIACFGQLAEMLANEITFFFLAREMVHRRYILSKAENKFRTCWLNGLAWHRPPNDDRHLNDIRPIIKNGYDIIILGAWDEPSYLLLWLWAIIARKKVLFSIESTAYDAYNGPHKDVKEYYKRLLMKHASGCCVPGKRAYEYCSALGMAHDRIFIAPNSTDREYFNKNSLLLAPVRENIRTKYEMDHVTLLFVGRLVEEHKKVSTLIEAFGKLVQSGLHATLVLVGEGPDKAKYQQMVKEQEIRGIHFLGEMKHEQICEVYAGADILVLPSRSEAWGFVLNEGMEFGLPLVVSEAVGAGPDLVHEGENGFVFPVGDSDKLAEILGVLVRDESLRKRMGEASKRIIQDFTPEAWAKGVVKAIEAVTGKAV